MIKPTALAVVFLAASWALAAQEPAAVTKPPSFEVASIKPNNLGRPFPLTMLRGATWNSTSTTLQILINFAYELRPYQLIGGPGWMATDRFDVIATAASDPAPTTQTVRLMLRSLLEERFALAVHKDTRDLPVYRLVLARADGTLGPKLVKAPLDCAANRAGAANRGAPDLAAAQAMLSGAAPLQVQPCGTASLPGRILLRNIVFDNFARQLEGPAARPIVDQTGLSGQYDVDLEWAALPDDPLRPSIFTALQEQLGLKLEPARGPVEVLVVDRAERPTPN